MYCTVYNFAVFFGCDINFTIQDSHSCRQTCRKAHYLFNVINFRWSAQTSQLISQSKTLLSVDSFPEKHFIYMIGLIFDNQSAQTSQLISQSKTFSSVENLAEKLTVYYDKNTFWHSHHKHHINICLELSPVQTVPALEYKT